MTRRPYDPGESPGSRFGIWLAAVAGAALFVALALLADAVVPGGLRDDGQGHGCCAEVSQP